MQTRDKGAYSPHRIKRQGARYKGTRRIGDIEEKRAASFLEERGCNIIEKNYSCRAGEIDLIYTDMDGVICFGEVKYRNKDISGRAEEAVNKIKQRKICRASDYYRAGLSLDEGLCYRYDVIALYPDREEWIRDAFEYIGRY